MNRLKFQTSGMTLIELVITIVVLSVAFTGLMAAYANIVNRSVDPQIYQQSLNIANSVMEEIAAKQFPASVAGACPSAGDPNDRPLWDDTCDYNGYSVSDIKDVAGNDTFIEGYGIQVTVLPDGTTLGFADNNHALLITVTITHPLGSSLSISAYRTRY